jgi:hypothetical protein
MCLRVSDRLSLLGLTLCNKYHYAALIRCCSGVELLHDGMQFGGNAVPDPDGQLLLQEYGSYSVQTAVYVPKRLLTQVSDGSAHRFDEFWFLTDPDMLCHSQTIKGVPVKVDDDVKDHEDDSEDGSSGEVEVVEERSSLRRRSPSRPLSTRAQSIARAKADASPDDESFSSRASADSEQDEDVESVEDER